VSFIVAELGPDADPFMRPLYAALAEKERRLIRSGRGRHSGKKNSGMKLDPTYIEEAGALGREIQVKGSQEFAAGLMPVLKAIRDTGATTLRAVSAALNQRGAVSTLRDLLKTARDLTNIRCDKSVRRTVTHGRIALRRQSPM
jgi:hypothetical protein